MDVYDIMTLIGLLVTVFMAGYVFGKKRTTADKPLAVVHFDPKG